MHPNNTLPRSPPLTCTSPARPPPRPGSPNRPKQLEGSLYSWVPLKSLKRAIVVFYNPDDAERARQASDRSILLPANSSHTQKHPACFPWCTYSISSRPVKRASPRSVLRRRLGRRERDLRVALPPPPSHARAQLPDLTPRKPTCWLGTDAQGALQRGGPR